MDIKLRYLALGLVALLGSLLASSSRISAYAPTDRPSSSWAAGPSVTGTSTVPPDGASPAPRNLAAFTIYLPILSSPASIPTPGYWPSDNLVHEFYVTPDSNYVRNHTIKVYIEGCGNHEITYPGPVLISANQYSITGAFYASGTFHSATTATVTDGLESYDLLGCGPVSGGPWTRNYNWQNSAQPPLTAHVVGREISSSIPTDRAVEVIKLR